MTEDFKFYIGGKDNFISTEVKNSAGEKKYYVTGYVSTKALDLVGDIVTDDCLKDLAEQINTGNIKLDVDHEAWKEGSPDMLPVGRIVEAKYEEGKIWVKAQINSHSDRFDKVWGNIKEKFLDAFSIAYKPITAVRQVIGEKTVRLLERVKLLNVALTGNPANPEARITAVLVKSLNSLEEEKSEEDNMTEEKIETPVVEQPVEEPVVEQPVVEEKSENNDELKTQLEELKNIINAQSAEMKSMKELLEKPQFKSTQETAPEPVVEVEQKIVNPLSLI